MMSHVRLVDMMRDVFIEMDAIDNVPAHMDDFAPIVSHRWRKLGHPKGPSKAQLRDKLQDYWPDSAEWKKRAAKGHKWPHWFINHGESRWSLRSDSSATDEIA